MIYGKTYEEKHRENQQRLKNFTYYRKFAFFPITLDNGKKVWLQFYKQKPLIYIHYGILIESNDVVYKWVGNDIQE